MKKNIVIITGIAGFIGSTLLPKLLRKNTLVIGIDNLRLGKTKYIKKYLKFKNFKFLKIDLSKRINNSKLKNLLKNNNVAEFWLLAANSDISSGIKNYNVDYKNTFLTTYNILRYCEKNVNSKTKILFASSSAIYGTVKNNIHENTAPLKPESNYGSMKLASESFICSYSFKHKIKSLIFRFPNVVGKNLTHGVIYDLTKKILSQKNFLQVLGNGEQRKPYSDVNELIKCMLYLKLKKNNELINFYNIGSNDDGVKVKKIVELLTKKFSYKSKIKYQKNKRGWLGDVIHYRYSTSKINKLGFKFKLSSLESLKKSINSISKDLFK